MLIGHRQNLSAGPPAQLWREPHLPQIHHLLQSIAGLWGSSCCQQLGRRRLTGTEIHDRLDDQAHVTTTALPTRVCFAPLQETVHASAESVCVLLLSILTRIRNVSSSKCWLAYCPIATPKVQDRLPTSIEVYVPA